MREAARLWASALVRRHRVATLVLALIAGFAAAMPMATWASGRRTGDTVDQFVEHAASPDLYLNICPRGVDPSIDGDLSACLTDDLGPEIAEIRTMPEVRAASFASWTFLQVDAGDGDVPATMMQLGPGHGSSTWSGEPVVVAGRLADPRAPDELVVNDLAAGAIGVGPGDQVAMRPAADGPGPGGSESFTSTVTGVVRTIGELLPVQGSSFLSSGGPMFHAAGGWSAAHGDAVTRTGNSVVVWLRDGDVDRFLVHVQERFPGQVINPSPAFDPEMLATVEQAVSYETRAVTAIVVALAIAAGFLAAQAIVRQSRRESDDQDVLRALGATRRDLVVACILRWAVTAAISVVTATAFVVAASALGPIGIGRRGPWRRGLAVDPVVLGVGLPLVALIVVGAGITPVLRRGHRRPAGAVAGIPGSPSFVVGVGMALRSVRRGVGVPILSAVMGIAVAVAVLLAAAAGSSAVRRATDEPLRFGADWDAVVGFNDSVEEQEANWRAVAGHPDVVAASGIPGSSVRVGDGELWIQAHVPIDGVEPVDPVITAGRAPVGGDEIALGTVTMRREGVGIGDRIELRPLGGNRPPATYEIVGAVMVTDGFEPLVGAGAVVAAEGLDRVAREATGGAAVRVTDGPGRDAVLERLQDDFPATFMPVAPPASLQNIERIAGLPVAFGALTAVLAAITLTHALLVCVRRQRHELAVCKSIGFTRRQVVTTVMTQATLLGALALVVGIPAGIIAARWGWRIIARDLGLAMEASMPLWIVAAAVVGVLVVANLAAAAPGWRAGRIPAADALRAE